MQYCFEELLINYFSFQFINSNVVGYERVGGRIRGGGNLENRKKMLYAFEELRIDYFSFQFINSKFIYTGDYGFLHISSLHRWRICAWGQEFSFIKQKEITIRLRGVAYRLFFFPVYKFKSLDIYVCDGGVFNI